MVQSMLVKSMLAILKQSWFILTCQKGGVKKVTNRKSASPTTTGRQPSGRQPRSIPSSVKSVAKQLRGPRVASDSLGRRMTSDSVVHARPVNAEINVAPSRQQVSRRWLTHSTASHSFSRVKHSA
eukprot:Selendium_serpulae@DN4093_c0_g1_i1.p1